MPERPTKSTAAHPTLQHPFARPNWNDQPEVAPTTARNNSPTRPIMTENSDSLSAKHTLQFQNSRLSRLNDTRVDKAWRFAENAHKGQKRKVSGLPFFVHPVGAA